MMYNSIQNKSEDETMLKILLMTHFAAKVFALWLPQIGMKKKNPTKLCVSKILWDL